MNNQTPASHSIPAGRVDEPTLLHEQSLVSNSELITILLNAMPELVLVLNEQRQIVAANQRLLETFGVEDSQMLLGLRPGEAVGCIHAHEGPDGCGSAKNVRFAGRYLPFLPVSPRGSRNRGSAN